MEPSEVKTSFQDIETGWSCIFFASPPKLAKSRFHALLQALETWRISHPMRRVESIQVVKSGRKVRGLNVMWSMFEHLQKQSRILHFQIDEELRDLYGHEYVEALMSDAVGFAADNPTPSENLVMVSRRKVAIVINRRDGQSYLMTFDKFLKSIDLSLAADIGSQFDAWCAQNEQGYFCAVLPDDLQA